MIEKSQIDELEGSGRGPGYGVFDDTESYGKEVTPPDYDITTTLPNLSQADIGIDTTGERIPFALVGAFVLLGVVVMGFFYLYWSRSNKENKKVKSLLENVDVSSRSMKHQPSL